MERLNGLLLTEWEKEDIIDLLEDYPEFFEMNPNELKEISKKLYREAQGYIETGSSIEYKADTITNYLRAIGEKV